jgi:(+)-trans-carveol dehydrogenase
MAGRVVLVTGAGRGQGRAHAVRLAEEGADVVAVDLGHDVDTVAYPLATRDDLDETAGLVEGHGRRVVSALADVRDRDALEAVVRDAVGRLGRLDGVVANAGVVSYGRAEELSRAAWQDVIDVNLTGVWNTTSVATPHLRAAGGGSIVITSSGAGLAGLPNGAHYAAAKHGLVGLMRTLAMELGRDGIRVNSVHPAQVDTPMIQNETMYALFDRARPTRERFEEVSRRMNLLPVPWVEPGDVANAVLFLLSDEARYVTGVPLPVDAGALTK